MMKKLEMFPTTAGMNTEKESRMTSSRSSNIGHPYLIAAILAALLVGCGRDEPQPERSQEMSSRSQPVQSDRTTAQASTDTSVAALQSEHTRELPGRVSDRQASRSPEYRIVKADDDHDGYEEKRAYFLPGEKCPAKMGYDYTRDGKDDFFVTVSSSGELLALEIDREAWPIDAAIATPTWRAEKRTAAMAFWERSLGGRPSAVCDVCNATVPQNGGYLLNTRELLSSQDYINRKDPMAAMFGMGGIDHEYNKWTVFFQNSAATPWLLCDECIGKWDNQ
jgi:hypothetical protein